MKFQNFPLFLFKGGLPISTLVGAPLFRPLAAWAAVLAEIAAFFSEDAGQPLTTPGLVPMMTGVICPPGYACTSNKVD